MMQISPEAEAFSYIIGFARSLPYFFEVNNTAKGALSCGHKKLMIIISSLIELRYNDLYKAILRHNLPIEYYIADKLSTLLCTVFPTELLLRIYGNVIFEAASGNSMRAMGIILSGCILFLELNEKYIKCAKNPEEIFYIINNTVITNLDAQIIIDKMLELSHSLFAPINSTLGLFLFFKGNKANSPDEAEYAWTKKENELNTQQEKAKLMNSKIDELIKNISLIGKEESKENVESLWINNIVTHFSSYCSDHTKKQDIIKKYIYFYKVQNLDCHSLSAKFGEKTEEFIISPDGSIEQGREFLENCQDIQICIDIPEKGRFECTINVNDIETNTPIVLDKILINTKENMVVPKDMPQPFISFVILLTANEEDNTIKAIKKSCIIKSQIIIKAPEGIMESVVFATKKQKQLCSESGVVIGKYEIEPQNSEAEKVLLRQLFSSLQKDPGVESPETNALVEKTLASYQAGEFSQRSLILSLVSASELSVYEKIDYFYDTLASMSGKDGFFLIKDLIEPIQLLYEQHLIPISQEAIPFIVEQVMGNVELSKITNAYLMSSSSNVSEELQKIHL